MIKLRREPTFEFPIVIKFSYYKFFFLEFSPDKIIDFEVIFKLFGGFR